MQVAAAVSSFCAFILASDFTTRGSSKVDLTPFEDSDYPALLCESPSLSSLNSLIFSAQSRILQRLSLPLSESTSTLTSTDWLIVLFIEPEHRQPKFQLFLPEYSISTLPIYIYIYIYTHSGNQCVLSEIITMFYLNFSDDQTQTRCKTGLMSFSATAFRL